MQTYSFIIGEKTEEYSCIADTNVHSKNDTVNYGNESYLFLASLKSMDLYAFAYISFNVTGIPRDAVISKVQIKLNILDIIVDKTVIFAIWECKAFEEYSITWNSIKNLDISDYNLVCSVEVSNTGVRAFTLNNEGYEEQEPHHVLGNGTYHFLLMVTDLSMLITSKETSYPPQLIVNFFNKGEVVIIPDFIFIAIPIAIAVSIILYNYYSRKKKISHYNKYSNHKVVNGPKKKQIYCIECGKPRIDENPLCSSCGFSFIIIESHKKQGKDDVKRDMLRKIICPSCSNELWAGAVYCSYCNFSLIKRPQNGNQSADLDKIITLTAQIENMLEPMNQTDHEVIKWHTWFINQRNKFIDGYTQEEMFFLQLKNFKKFLENINFSKHQTEK